MTSSLARKLRDMLEEKDIQLLDIYRYAVKKGSEYLFEDKIRVKDKASGKIYTIPLGAAKESMELEAIVEKITSTIKEKEEQEASS
ncbi:MAG: hypothetical protein LRS47_00535 [Desulfurococcales archaeon]|nr:hypothetical protein [Desulfurococcales archaeon]